jgi:hypothetical protein
MLQLNDNECFIDAGVYSCDPIPKGYKKICIHLEMSPCDVKHDRHHKEHLIGDRHLTDIPVESIYSGFVSLHGLQMVNFLAELHSTPVHYLPTDNNNDD